MTVQSDRLVETRSVARLAGPYAAQTLPQALREPHCVATACRSIIRRLSIYERLSMPGILCEHCTGACCRYIALPIDTPEERSDFDDLRWYLLHEGISIFVEDGDWYISMVTNCRHLQPDYRCGIYETRPKICRDYSADNCDYHSGDYGWEHHFATPEHLDEYLHTHFLPAQRSKKSKRRGRKPIGGGGRTKVKLRNKRLRRGASFDYAAATTDIRGVPLPVIPAPR